MTDNFDASEAVPASEVLFDDLTNETIREELPLLLSVTTGGERLDKWLAMQLPEHSRAEIQRWIANGRVMLGEKPLKASFRVTSGDELAVTIPEPADYAVEPEPIPLDVIYEDADLLVINKPAGMVVHPAAGNWHSTLVHAILYHCPDLEGVGGVHRPGIVHRLDKDTSGIILVAKNDLAHRALQAQFKDRTVQKTYRALVHGWLHPEQGQINAPIGRDPRHRSRMAVTPLAQGRTAATEYTTLQYYRGRGHPDALYTLVACHPLTGRTHQIRVHLAYIHHPIVGDAIYGGSRKTALNCPRQFLHAERIRFRLPTTGIVMEFSAELPPDLLAVLSQLQVEG